MYILKFINSRALSQNIFQITAMSLNMFYIKLYNSTLWVRRTQIPHRADMVLTFFSMCEWILLLSTWKYLNSIARCTLKTKSMVLKCAKSGWLLVEKVLFMAVLGSEMTKVSRCYHLNFTNITYVMTCSSIVRYSG